MTSFETLWTSIEPVGRHRGTGGYRRFAWTDADLTLREWFHGAAAARGMTSEEDRNANLWAWLMPAGWTGDPSDAFVTGSHLDSVPDGGAFDGPLGVVSAFAAIDELRARGVTPRRPIAVAAFADEEGARFGVACVGSQLSTGALTADRARALTDADGITLAAALRTAGRDPEHLGVDPRLADRVGVYVELHVEQGRALDLVDRPLAVASTIWPHGRWRFTLDGQANHAGTTRLVDRHDPMLAFASTIHQARSSAAEHGAVATFGKAILAPNGANAIASQVQAWLDARAADAATLAAVVDDIAGAARQLGAEDGVAVTVDIESQTPIVMFPEAPRQRVIAALSHRGDLPVLPTQAGHDAGILSAVVPTAMVFVRNPTGISHSPEEFAEMADCHVGVAALTDLMADWVSG